MSNRPPKVQQILDALDRSLSNAESETPDPFGWIEIKDGCEMPPNTEDEIWVTHTLGCEPYTDRIKAKAFKIYENYAVAWKYAEKKPEPFTPKPITP